MAAEWGLTANEADRLEKAISDAYHANRKAPFPGLSLERMMGLEPTTFCMASRRSSQLSYIRWRA